MSDLHGNPETSYSSPESDTVDAELDFTPGQPSSNQGTVQTVEKSIKQGPVVQKALTKFQQYPSEIKRNPYPANMNTDLTD